MPTYQYACTNEACGVNFERVQSFTEDAVSICPECAGRVRKVYGSVGVVFKGSGFYRNDSRDAKSSTREEQFKSRAHPPPIARASSLGSDEKSVGRQAVGSWTSKSDSGSSSKSSSSETKSLQRRSRADHLRSVDNF